MDYCTECKSQECRYIEVCEFLNCVTAYTGKKFEICECPDKMKLNYTCDMVWIENDSKEKIYVEIKEVKYGFGNEKDRNIAVEKGQLYYGKLISEVIEQSDIDKEIELSDFVITIPRAQIGVKDVKLFCEELKEFINSTTFEKDEYSFVYNRNSNDIIILFKRKTDDIMQEFGDKLLFSCAAVDNNTIHSIFEKLTDVNKLKDQIIRNLKNTSQKKFPKEADRKILLNILKLPIGYDLFFNMNIEYMIENLMNESYDSISDANESYLLYYCDNYSEIKKDNDKVLFEQKGRVLFVIPLMGGLMQDAIEYQIC